MNAPLNMWEFPSPNKALYILQSTVGLTYHLHTYLKWPRVTHILTSVLYAVWHWHSWKVWHENNTGISNAQYCLYCVLCSWILIILMTMRLRRKEEKKVELYTLGTCLRGWWGWSVPDLDIGTWISRSQRSGPRGNCHGGREQDITRREQSEQTLRSGENRAQSRSDTGQAETCGQELSQNNGNMPGITVAPVRSRVTLLGSTR